MVRRVEVRLVDDLDGGTADESVTFSLDGITYEIDLSKEHAGELRSALEPFVAAAQKVAGSSTRHRVGGMRGRRAPARTDRAQNQAIRDWAIRNGLEVSPRGRISRAVMEQYEAQAGR
jgi:hypothetical protein